MMISCFSSIPYYIITLLAIYFVTPYQSYPSLSPVTTVEVAIADGFGNMLALNLFRALEVGDGAGHLQDTAVGTGGELQAFHGHAQHVEALGVGLSKLMKHALGHLSVAMGPASPTALAEREGAEALCLDIAGLDDTLTNGS